MLKKDWRIRMTYMRRCKFLIFKTVFTLFAFLLLNCEEKQECDAICEARKAEFERLTMRVIFHIEFNNINNYFYARKTATGMIANYKPWEEIEDRLEAELSQEEWLNFIRTLHKYLDKDLNEWGEVNKYFKGSSSFDCVTRKLYIDYPDSAYGVVRYKGWAVKPLDWNMVEKTIDDMRSLIRKKAEVPIDAKVKTEYQKKFGEPITDIELSTSRIKFWFASSKEKNSRNGLLIFVTRTKTGVILEYDDAPEIEIGIDEWLDFIRALYKSGIDKWEEKYGEEDKSELNDRWELDIYYSDKSDFKRVIGYNAYPQNLGGFMKAIDGIKPK